MGAWTYTYDEFNRLTGATGGASSFTYAYDRYGNRWQQNAPQGGPAPQLTFNANNQIEATNRFAYDAAGNVTWDGDYSYCYDAEGRLLKVDSGQTTACLGNVASYTYDPNGLRVKVTKGTESKDYVYDLAGREIAEVSAAGVWNRGEVYVGGAHVATYADGTTYFRHTDWLGTLRALTKPDNPAPATTCTSLPFGDGQSCASSASTRNLFTDYVHDAETNLEHSWFRQYGSRAGSFYSPDPVLGSVGDPQSWNRYAYVLNSPTNLVDPVGLTVAIPGFCPAEFASCRGGDDWGGGGGGGGWGGGGTIWGQTTWDGDMLPRGFGSAALEAWREGLARYFTDPDGPSLFPKNYEFTSEEYAAALNSLLNSLLLPSGLFGGSTEFQRTSSPDNLGLKLEPYSDFCNAWGRNIEYRIIGRNGGRVLGDYYVHEILLLDGGGTFVGQSQRNGFSDIITIGLGTPPLTHVQMFRIAMTSGGAGVPIPIQRVLNGRTVTLQSQTIVKQYPIIRVAGTKGANCE